MAGSRVLAAVALSACAFACSSKSVPAGAGSASVAAGSAAAWTGIALDVLGFDPPFEDVPLARDFLRAHEITRVRLLVLEPGNTVAREAKDTDYDANGLATRTSELSAETGYTWKPVATFTNVVTGERIDEIDELVDANKIELKYEYDAAGKLVRRVRGDGEELRSYDASGRLVKYTRGAVDKSFIATIELDYDAQGRIVAMRGNKPGFDDDRYTFTYADGQLATMAFVESGKPIYDRTYTYDREGWLVRVTEHPTVPAMGDTDKLTYYEYELAHTATRRSPKVTLPAKPAHATDPEVLAAARRVVPELAGATATWVSGARTDTLERVTFELPKAVPALRKPATACALLTVIAGNDELCACAKLVVKDGPPVIATLYTNPGC